jgi:hypothetical protein
VLDEANNVIWMLDKGGLLEISIGTGKQVSYPGNYADAPGMCYDASRKMIWLNTTDGLLQFEPRDPGIDIFNPQTGQFRLLKQKDITAINKRYMVPLVIDTTNQNVLVAAGEPYGLYKLNIPTLQSYNIIFKDSAGHDFSSGDYGFQAVKPYKKSALILVDNHRC